MNSRTAPSGYQPGLTGTRSPGAVQAGGLVCVFKNIDPWGSPAAEEILSACDIPFEIHTSADFASLDFSQYVMIVVSSDQPQAFYDAYAANQGKFADYVSAGGFLNFFACDRGWAGGRLTAPLPGGMTTVLYYAANTMTIVDPGHPVVSCVPDPIYGS